VDGLPVAVDLNAETALETPKARIRKTENEKAA